LIGLLCDRCRMRCSVRGCLEKRLCSPANLKELFDENLASFET
jgi:hypothetical protein